MQIQQTNKTNHSNDKKRLKINTAKNVASLLKSIKINTIPCPNARFLLTSFPALVYTT